MNGRSGHSENAGGWPSKKGLANGFCLLALCEAITWLALTIAAPCGGVLFAVLVPVFLVQRRKWGILALWLLMSPFGTLFPYHSAEGVWDYGKGTAVLRYMGLPGLEFWNLDRQTRCPKSTGGCLVGGHAGHAPGGHRSGKGHSMGGALPDSADSSSAV